MDIISLDLNNFNLIITVNIVLAIVLIIIFAISTKLLSKKFSIEEINFGIGENCIKLKVDNSLKYIAYKILIELKTRLIAYPLSDDDVIVEVYNSWYTAFGTIRSLLKDITIEKNNAIELSNLTIKLLNMIFRKHLTKWQAKFRRWYETELAKDENKLLSPQEIQKKYIDYDNLVSDLKMSQIEIEKFIIELEKLIKC